MQTDLESSIRDALAGSSGQKPVDVSRLYRLGDKADVEAALLDMYRSREVYCCLYIRPPIQLSPASGRKGKRENHLTTETSVWWISGASGLPRFTYNKALKNPPPGEQP